MDSCANSLRLFSPAKLNLSLRIVGRRADGYHEIESLFWPISLGDEIVVKPADKKIRLCRWADDAPRPFPELPPETENIAFRAWELGSGEEKTSVEILKRIPMGGGLGGGSSNAGTLLRHLGKKFPALPIQKLALALGADVPFFLNPHPSWVSGIGEKQSVINVDPTIVETARFVIVIPPFACETKKIFQTFKARATPFSTPETTPPTEMDTKGWKSFFRDRARNDLEETVSQDNPLLQRITEALRATDCYYAGLSGSGSSCFAIYPDETKADSALKDLRQFCRKYQCSSLKAVTFNAT